MTVTIYRNPSCGTSRNTLAMIRATGVAALVIEYLKTPPSRSELLGLVRRMGVPSRRRKGGRLCRPSEAVSDLLDAPLPAGFVQEDGAGVTAQVSR